MCLMYDQQYVITRRTYTSYKFTDAYNNRVVAANVRADKLTQSILAKAFRGELVPTEAELARQEGRAYESASVLLERIRSERMTNTRDSSRGRKIKAR